MDALRCSICNQAFNRREHLRRHMRIHTREKPYQCSFCEKSFSRPDVLNRHTISHHDSGDSSIANASSRACRQCAASRVRCPRGQPCRRCAKRMLPCQYPAAAPRKRTWMQNLLDAQGSEQSPENEALLDQAGAHQLSPSTENLPGEPNPPLPWIGPVDGIGTLYNINGADQSGICVSGVNWMSPGCELAVDWDALLSDYSANNNMHSEAHSGIGGRAPQEEEMQTDSHPENRTSRSVVRSTISSHSSEGRYYVDGSGARASFGGRAHTRESISLQPQALDVLCSRAAYDGLVRVIEAERLPHLSLDLAQMQTYVDHYFDNFHRIFPFLRKSSFENDSLKEPLLLLAVTVVGSRYARRLQGSQPSNIVFRTLRDILRRCRYGYGYGLEGGDESNERNESTPQPRLNSCGRPSLEILQAGILNLVCMMHSGDKAMVERALVDRHYLVEACHSLGLLSGCAHEENIQRSSLHGNGSIRSWIECESRTRIGFMIWLLDSLFVYELDTKPLIQIDDINATLPSHEEVWENPHLVEQGKWHFCVTTLPAAMELVYMEKRLPSHLGEFSIGLLINGIYRNTSQITARGEVRLNLWVPTATPQQPSDLSSLSQRNASIVTRWRNSACDCLDVLHWPANSKIAQLCGYEHHTILHLHLARLIILTPTTHIQTFATGQNAQQLNSSQSTSRYATARQQVLQWVLHDRYKARLSIVHCGALYWHVRRYSCDSVLEPYAIYIATLVLWAFCVSMELSEGVEASAQEPEEEPEPSFLHLDRPLDDELVQTFVRLGHKMSAYISKVGNIRSRGAPAKILHEGISLLTREGHSTYAREHGLTASQRPTCYTWGVEKTYLESLHGVLQTIAGSATVDQ